MPWKPDKLRFGGSGIPTATTKPNTINGIAMMRRCGLDAMELEFVHSVNISQEKANDVQKAAKAHDIALTAHGQYFINLSSREPEKRVASMQRVLTAARRAYQCGAWSMTFHAGFYAKRQSNEVTQQIHEGLHKIATTLRDEGTDIWVRPETAGKLSQWGDIPELIDTCSKFENVLPCIDFSHLYARSCGVINGYEEFSSVLAQLEQGLNKECLQNVHIHAQGIEFGRNGEKRHLLLQDSAFDYKGLLRALKEFQLKGSIICEGPIPEKDAKTMQVYYEMHG